MNTVLINLGSLILGFIAIILPIHSYKQHKKKNVYKGMTLTLLGLFSAMLAVLFQLLNLNGYVMNEDIASLMDVIGFLTNTSVVLVVLVVIVNIWSLSCIIKLDNNSK